MKTDELIPVNEICIHHGIERSFVLSLRESGLLEVITLDEETYVPIGELRNLEKMANLHYEMDINIEGIEAITHLLQRVNDLQQQVAQLLHRLDVHEARG
jgi:chaperone modulatory protein CbpM